MLREYLATARSQVQSVTRRIFNNIGLNDNDDAGLPIQNRIFSFLSRKFGSHLKYFIFSSVLLLLYLLSVIAEAEKSYAKSLSTIPSNKESTDLLVPAVPENDQQNKFVRNSSISRHDNSKNSAINPSFLLSLFFTFIGWLALINLLRYMRAWVISRTVSSLPTAATNQRDAMLMLQRLILLNDSDPSTLPSRLRLAILQRDFNADDYELLQQLDNDNLPPSHRVATDAQINLLPTHIVSEAEINDGLGEEGGSGSRMENGGVSLPCCNICLAPYEVGDELRTVKCMHKFHKLCIDRWLRMNAVCPVCKNLAVE